MKQYIIYTLLLFMPLLAACDEGDIPDKAPVLDSEGRAAKVSMHLTGAASWPTGYTVAIAAFSNDSEYAKYVKGVSSASDEYTAYNIPDDVNTLEICVVNTLRGRVATFATMDISQITDTIRFDAGEINASMFQTIQDNIFTKRCAACHGGSSGHAAANLYLNEGRSYESLVGHASTVVEGMTRVVAGSSSESELYQVLTTTLTNDWNRPHSNFMSSDDDIANLTLIKDWIDNGAKE